MFCRLDSTFDRYGDRRRQSSRDLSPQKPAIRSDFVPHYDSYRPSSALHAVRDLGSFSRTADTYRPQYQDDAWTSSHTSDSVSYQRRPTCFDRAEERQGSSISSTPPRLSASLPQLQHRSPPPRPLAETELYQSSSIHFPVADSGHQSLSSSLSLSRASSIFREGPDTKSESRSSSRSPRRSRSGISELDETSTLPQLSIQPVQEKALSRVTNEVPFPGDAGNAPLERSKCPGIVVHISANKQSSSHQTIFTNGNYAANQEALEGNASPLPIPKSVSCSDATPHRGACAARIKKAPMLTMRCSIAS